ncbi:hypothetical protein EJB05_25789 [Eragrostis curvula]|uniref:Uncharacterized protein n=1 Tax=Eragrostis curvula TaxID=38414 RepID=A0A5J9UIX0_9POAL|nr:hypothetical protein EJB05_25789 [Eragrostis curvula]
MGNEPERRPKWLPEGMDPNSGFKLKCRILSSTARPDCKWYSFSKGPEKESSKNLTIWKYSQVEQSTPQDKKKNKLKKDKKKMKRNVKEKKKKKGPPKRKPFDPTSVESPATNKGTPKRKLTNPTPPDSPAMRTRSKLNLDYPGMKDPAASRVRNRGR